MRRQDREEPAVTRANDAAEQVQMRKHGEEEGQYRLRTLRRAKAALPPGRYEAFVGGAILERDSALAGLVVAGHSVSRKSRQTVAASIDGELAIIAGLRSGESQAAPEFAEGNAQEAFA